MSPLKRLLRDHFRYDLLNLLAIHGQEEKVSLQSSNTHNSFMDKIHKAIQVLHTDDRLLHGQRTQAMFEALVASLGCVQILKQEDAGDIYAIDESLKIPDFRLILDDKTQMLVEVKNHYTDKDILKPFELKQNYFDGLIRYSKIMNCELKVAIYWAKWNMWTLVSPSTFQRVDDNSSISFQKAVLANEMVILGDFHVGTKFPLRLRILMDKSKPRSINNNGEVRFTIGGFEFYCENRRITDPVEKKIAWYLMLYGKWQEENPEAITTGNQLDAIEHRWIPPEDYHQGFELVGCLSEMFSRFYNHITLDNAGQPEQLRIVFTPGAWGQLIPDNYQSDALPLWRFRKK